MVMCNAGCTYNMLAMWSLFLSWNCQWCPSRLWVHHHTFTATFSALVS